jgi:hypothetical protein
VVGVVHNGVARAYDWNDLQRLTWITDTLGGDSIVIHFDQQDGSFRVMRKEGVPHNKIIPTLPAHQEFWHSWRTFHQNTTRYVPNR